jgi:small subunit ribosomal protein S1
MDLFFEEFTLHVPTAGEIRQGWIVEHNNNDILVDIGAKSEGIISSRDLESVSQEEKEVLTVGAQIMVYVVDPEDKDGNIILSYRKAMEEKSWVLATELLENQDVHNCEVIGVNRGGLLVQLDQARGFVPNSQLSRDRQLGNNPDNVQRTLQKLVGKSISIKVIEVDRPRNRLILSERAAAKEIRASKRADLLANVKTGDTHNGRVVNLTDYGAFVDIGGIEGLVHLSELSWKRINNPREKVKVGDEVKVYVLSIDQKKERIALSIKQLEPDPWEMVEEHYHIGQLVEASITKLTKFGAFARLNDDFELEGLIHISELSEEHIEHPSQIVKSTDIVSVRIIRIDADQRQLGLSLKQVSSAKFLEMDMALATDFSMEEEE